MYTYTKKIVVIDDESPGHCRCERSIRYPQTASRPIPTNTVMDDITVLECRREKAKVQRLRRKNRIKIKKKPQTSSLSHITIDSSTSTSHPILTNTVMHSSNVLLTTPDDSHRSKDCRARVIRVAA